MLITPVLQTISRRQALSPAVGRLEAWYRDKLPPNLLQTDKDDDDGIRSRCTSAAAITATFACIMISMYTDVDVNAPCTIW